MSIVRWDPFRELEDMSDRLNRVFGRSGVRSQAGQESMTVADWTPPVDICETEREYLIKTDLPELKREDVKITIQEGVLTLFGERKLEQEEKGKKFHRVERSYGSFWRTFSLPDNVDETRVTADFRDGVLTLHLPKSEKARSRTIDIKVG